MSLVYRQNGMIRLIFANEDDYYQPSLMKMTLDQYIYYRLKREYYDEVVFLKRVYLEYKSVFELYTLSGLKCDSQYYNNKICSDKSAVFQYDEDDSKRTLNMILRLLLSDSKNAVVIDLDVMDGLLQYEEFYNELVSAFHINCRSVLVLKASFNADQSFHSLSMLAKKFPDLFEVVNDVLKKKSKTMFYRQLGIEMGNNISFIQSTTTKQIQYMLQRMILDGTYKGKECFLNEYTYLFSSFFYESKEKYKLSDNKRNLMISSVRELKKLLCDSKVWDTADCIIQDSNDIKCCGKNGLDIVYPRFSANRFMDKLQRSLETERFKNSIDFKALIQTLEDIIDTCRCCWSNSAEIKSYTTEIGQCLQLIDEYRDIHKEHSELLAYSPVSVLVFKMQYEVEATLNGHLSNIDVFTKTIDAILDTSINVMDKQRQYDRQHAEMLADIQCYQNGLVELQKLQKEKEKKEKDYYSEWGDAGKKLFGLSEFDLLQKLKNKKQDLKAFEEKMHVKDALNQKIRNQIVQSKIAIDNAFACLKNLSIGDSTDMKDALEELEDLMKVQFLSDDTYKESLKKLNESLQDL